MPVDTTSSAPLSTFAQLGLPPSLVKALSRAQITSPTPVQEAVIPDALAGRDVLGRAMTGSGKTLAFGLPILTRLRGTRSKPKSPRALVIVPTRELAGQVRASLEPMADAVGLRVATVYGGTPYDRQIKRLRAGVDIVVATPGRLDDLIRRGACRLDHVEVTVLDEADHLCDLGFFPAVSELVAMTPTGGQRLLLSATLDGDVDKLVRRHLSSPVTHDCDADGGTPDIDHHVFVTGPHNKLDSLVELLRANPRSIVFTRTRNGATTLASDLARLGVTTVDLHGSLSQGARERNLRKFRTGSADVVVATDVAARGIHVDGVRLVVHYDAPSEAKAYLHRSGRTARAGQSGAVVTMTTTRHVAALIKLQKAIGVTSLHHDARTAPRPLTASSLALHGLPAQSSGTDEAPRAARQAPKRVGRSGDAPRATAGRTFSSSGRSGDGPRAAAGRASSSSGRSADRPRRDNRVRGRGHLQHASAGPSDVRQPPADGPRRSRPARPSRPAAKPSTQPRAAAASGGRRKKPRWTAAERRAGSKR